MAGIDNIRSGHSLVNTNRASAKTEQSRSSEAQNTSGTPRAQQDAVSLSDQGRAISSQMNTAATFDNAKVQAIKEAIANGSYVVDADKLADNMIRFEKELGDVN